MFDETERWLIWVTTGLLLGYILRPFVWTGG